MAAAAVWGIDIGQSALKALRCRAGDQPGTIVAEACDFVEYPSILGQPDTDDAAVIKEALKTFMSRNSLRGDQVAISVSGQNGLARFIKLPPVEAKKIPDIVRYEARQQIPFKLEEVIWDYQQLPGGGETEGFALEAEVGLFAMKRDQVFRALAPLEQAGIEVHFIQLTPTAIFNFASFDQLKGVKPEEYDPENPPESTIIMSIGTETTDLVVTNGLRVWQRSIPLGGNHFTKALTKQLKLTFAKAEHMKRNAGAANPDDAKAIVKAMRPIFDDMVTEVQTSLRYFKMNVDKSANLGRIIGLGNAMKLLGLRGYLSQKLEMDVVRLDAYSKLSGPAVTASPVFKDNLLSFAVAYGLALQGLGLSTLRTNLLPQELNTQRVIRDKKPWAIAAAAGLMLGFTVNYMGEWLAWRPTNWVTDSGQKGNVDREIGTLTSTKKRLEDEFKVQSDTLTKVRDVGKRLSHIVTGPRLAPEMLKVINDLLPRNEPPLSADGTNWPLIVKRRDLQIESVSWDHHPSLNSWFKGDVKTKHSQMYRGSVKEEEAPPANADGEGNNEAQPAEQPEGESAAAPTGKGGWVVRIKGKHYHNATGDTDGATYLKQEFLDKLQSGSVTVYDAEGKTKTVKVSQLGIKYPTLVETSPIKQTPNPVFGILDAAKDKQPENLPTFEFTVEFWWEETPLDVRDAPAPPPSPDGLATTTE